MVRSPHIPIPHCTGPWGRAQLSLRPRGQRCSSPNGLFPVTAPGLLVQALTFPPPPRGGPSIRHYRGGEGLGPALTPASLKHSSRSSCSVVLGQHTPERTFWTFWSLAQPEGLIGPLHKHMPSISEMLGTGLLVGTLR